MENTIEVVTSAMQLAAKSLPRFICVLLPKAAKDHRTIRVAEGDHHVSRS
jgi:hypothetical protein